VKTIEIPNFTGREPVEIFAYTHQDTDIGNVVSIRQRCGSCSFQHSMTATQARDMAEALLAMADSFDEATS